MSAGSIPYVQQEFRARVPDVADAVESKNNTTDVVQQERRADVESVEGARVIVMYRRGQSVKFCGRSLRCGRKREEAVGLVGKETETCLTLMRANIELS